jgi:hypothetical protein
MSIPYEIVGIPQGRSYACLRLAFAEASLLANDVKPSGNVQSQVCSRLKPLLQVPVHGDDEGILILREDYLSS